MQHIQGCPQVLHLKDLHCTKMVQKKPLPFSGMLRRARGEGLPGWRASDSCKSVAWPWLTVNQYCVLDIIRMRLGLEVADSRRDGRPRRDCSYPCQNSWRGRRGALGERRRGL